jgi:hypothetical protein
VQTGQDREHRARQAAAVRAGFHREAAMSRQLERGWKLLRHRDSSTEGSTGLGRAPGGRLTRRPRERHDGGGRRASRPRRASAEAVRARDHAARRVGRDGGARRATNAIFH